MFVIFLDGLFLQKYKSPFWVNKTKLSICFVDLIKGMPGENLYKDVQLHSYNNVNLMYHLTNQSFITISKYSSSILAAASW